MLVVNLSARCAVRARQPPAPAQRGDGAAVPRFTWHSAGGDGHGRERSVLGVHCMALGTRECWLLAGAALCGTGAVGHRDAVTIAISFG